MGVLTIQGDTNKLNIILSEKRFFAKKYGLKMSLVEDKQEEAKSPPVKSTSEEGNKSSTRKENKKGFFHKR